MVVLSHIWLRAELCWSIIRIKWIHIWHKGLSRGMTSHTPIHWLWESHSDIKQQGDKGTTFPGDTLMAAVLMQASATVWSDVPTSLPAVYCSALSHAQCWRRRRSGGPLSSAPFTKQPLWSEARIRMIMWTLATVYQQVSCSCSAQRRHAGLRVFVYQGGKTTLVLYMCAGVY